jgi:resuscitation-promoting factor RpfB
MKKKSLLIAAAIIVCTAGLVAAWLHKTIYIDIDGQTSSHQTWSLTVGSALADAGIAVGTADQILPPQAAFLKNMQVVHIRRARQVQVMADGKVFSLLTVDAKPVAWLDQAGIILSPGDLLLSAGIPLDPHAPTSVQAVQVRRQHTLILNQGGVAATLHTSADNVGAALWEAGVRLHSADLVTPTIETIPQEGMNI